MATRLASPGAMPRPSTECCSPTRERSRMPLNSFELESPADHENCLVIRDLAVAYGRKVVLKGVQADIRRGQVVGIIGPNGGGKSTLLKAILGLAPVTAGTISLFGKRASQLRSRMAYVPQREL